MKTQDLWIKQNECCGCELCSQVCPNHIIEMTPDEEGFLYPQINDDTDCINCKRCLNVCPMKEPGRTPMHFENSFSYSLPEEKDLKKSASGGVVTAISREFIKRGGIVYGVAYSDDCLSVVFQRATSVEELEAFRGSKYVQAQKGEVYTDIRSNLKARKQVLFVGLPCEVSAVYHALTDATNLYTISLICHGPTSQKVHRDFCKALPYTDNRMTAFSVRYKKTGWKPYYIHAEYADGSVHEERWNTSDYGIAFQYLKRPSCLSCRYKSKDNRFGLQSDMIVGDYHALKKTAKDYNSWGVSQASVMTDKGRYLAGLIEEDTPFVEIPKDLIRTSNRALHQTIPQRGDRNRFVNDYQIIGLHNACNSSMVKRTDAFIRVSRKFIRIRAIKYFSGKIIRVIRKCFKNDES